MTETSPTTLTPVNKASASASVRRRFYVGCVVAFAIFFIGLGSWPFGVDTFRTSCLLDVRLNPDFAAKEPQSASTMEDSLRKVITKTLEAGSLAACIRRCTPPGSDSIASVRVPQLRSSLDVRIIRPADPRAEWRRIQIALVGKGDSFERQMVNEILQDLAGRLSRKSNWKVLDKQLRGHMDLVAQRGQSKNSQVLALLVDTKKQITVYQNQLNGLSDKLARYNGNETNHELEKIQKQLKEVQRQVVESDLNLVKEIHGRYVNQYQPKDDNPLHLHLQGLIQDRTRNLVAWGNQAKPQTFGVSGTIRNNPYTSASHAKKVQNRSQVQLDSIRNQFQQINMAGAYQLLGRLKKTVDSPEIKQASFHLEKAVEKQTSQFTVMKLQPSKMAFPAAIVPGGTWFYTLAFISFALGSTFTLTWKPQNLSKQLATPKQLAAYLGLQHLGSIDSKTTGLGFFEKVFRYVGITIFRACELVLLGVLCCLIVAIVWDNQLPRLLFADPLEFFFRSVWVLFGR